METANERRIRLHLHRHLDRLIAGGGWTNLGGDHDWFNATASAGRWAGVEARPLEMDCSSRGRIRRAARTVQHGIAVTYGATRGNAVGRFVCAGTVYRVRAARRLDVLKVAEAFTEQLAGTC